MQNNTVYFESIHEYNVDAIQRIIENGIRDLDLAIPSNAKILIKPNILGAYEPERYIDTHPDVVEATIRVLIAKNNTIIVGDSSGNGQYGNTGKALVKSGMARLSEKYDVTVKAFDKHTNRVFRNLENHIFKEINLTTFIDEVDWIVNIPKLKSHTFTGFSGAVKNFYGMIPGAGKPNGHRIAPNPIDFSNGLLDIYGFVRPKILLNIMDGIIGIEGAGPGPAGKIKEAGFIGLSKDAVALDAACLVTLDIDPMAIPLIRLAHKRGLLTGEGWKSTSIPKIDFKIPKPSRVEAFFNTIFPQLALSRPFVVREKCKKCALCEKACPGNAITMVGYPSFEYSKCIYCFCCHENCPEAAIDLKENRVFTIFRNLGSKD